MAQGLGGTLDAAGDGLGKRITGRTDDLDELVDLVIRHVISPDGDSMRVWLSALGSWGPRAKSQEPRAKSQVRISSYPGPSTVRASGMRVEKTERVRRGLLEAVVSYNLETIRGLPPGPLRTGRWLGAN